MVDHRFGFNVIRHRTLSALCSKILDQCVETMSARAFGGDNRLAGRRFKKLVWDAVDNVTRWLAEDPILTSSTLPTTREALSEKFEQRMEEWLSDERPERIFAERATLASRRLDLVPIERLKIVDLWCALLVLLDIS